MYPPVPIVPTPLLSIRTVTLTATVSHFYCAQVCSGAGTWGRRLPHYFRQGDASPTPQLFGLKFAQKQARRQEMKWGGVLFVKNVENGGVFCKTWKMGWCFCEKVDLSSTHGALCRPTVSVFFILHFTYLGGAYASNAPPTYGPEKLACYNWLLTETQCKIISVQQN